MKNIKRINPPLLKGIVEALALILALLHIANIIFMFQSHVILGLHLGFILILIFLGQGLPENKLLMIIDLLALAVSLVACANFSLNYTELFMKIARISVWNQILGAALILVVLYATYRTIGTGMTVIAGIFLLYVFLGQHIPGAAGHAGFRTTRIIAHLYISSNGVFGSLLQISATYLAIFTLFGAYLDRCEASNAFINLAISATGRVAGGPALAAVVASMLFGMINGSAVVNVVTTGTFTIPLMESLGVLPEIAGAVEAAASTGGQLMPPVMGAGAFIMSDITGVSYADVIRQAVIPALVYFIGVFSGVFFYIHKAKIPKMDPALIPPTKKILSELYLLIPFIAVLVLILMDYSPMFAALIAVAMAVTLVIIRNIKQPKVIVKKIAEGLIDGSKGLSSVACGLACAGVIVGCVTLTGLGSKFVTLVVTISGSYPLLALLLIAVACLILGMGLPTSAAYVITATMAAPAMVRMGFPLFASHLFIFYFAVIAPVTPPVAIAAYAGAGIAKGDPTRTGVNAFLFALPAFLCPFMFIYNPLLLGHGQAVEVIWAAVTAVAGAIAIGASSQKYLATELTLLQSLLLLGGAFLMLYPGLVTDLIGIAIIAVIVLWSLFGKKKKGGVVAA